MIIDSTDIYKIRGDYKWLVANQLKDLDEVDKFRVKSTIYPNFQEPNTQERNNFNLIQLFYVRE